jgi:hypothetical protein
MTAKAYLAQAYRIDQRINSKLEQLSSLRELSTKATATFSDVPSSGTRNVHRMEDVVCKIIMLEDDINTEIDRLVDLKKDICAAIGAVGDPEYQMLLELRYLCFKSWDQIAALMEYSTKYLFDIHARALKKIVVPEKSD